MELEPEERRAPDDGAEPVAVVGRRDDALRIGGGCVGVDEVEMRAVRHVGDPGMRAREVDLVPARVGHADVAADPPHDAAHEAETVHALVLFAAVEEELHADTETEERRAALAYDAHRRVETETCELPGTVAEVADAREHDGARREDLRRVARDADLAGAGPTERALDVREVAHAVVDDADHAAASSTSPAS